jgi:predicted acyltransferase
MYEKWYLSALISEMQAMNQRYYSLDVFRGATVALMILVNNPGSWSHIYAPLEHATWHGCTPTDLVFPFFLFAVGNAMAFVMPRFEQAGPSVFWRKVIKRTLLIFAIGLFLNWSPFVRWDGENIAGKAWQNVRIFGVCNVSRFVTFLLL